MLSPNEKALTSCNTPTCLLPHSLPIFSLTCCLALVADAWEGVHPMSSFPVAAQHACYDINAD